MSDHDTRPSIVAGGSAMAAALVVVAIAALSSVESAGIALVGFGLTGWAVRRGTAVALDLGALALFIAIVHGTVRAPSIGLALIGSLGVVLAWDLGHTARDIGRQLGRAARTTRLEAVRILTSVVTGLVAVTLGYVVFLTVGAVGSVGALIALVLSILFATIALGSGVSAVRTRDGGVFRDV